MLQIVLQILNCKMWRSTSMNNEEKDLHDSKNTQQRIWDYLGMTREDYLKWIDREGLIKEINDGNLERQKP